jgi:prefoldin subunit 5
MVEILDELNPKLAEIDAKAEELRRDIVVLDDQKAAFETVIRV